MFADFALRHPARLCRLVDREKIGADSSLR